MPPPKDPIKYKEWKDKIRVHNLKLNNNRIGKTYEEMYGVEKAKRMKEQLKQPRNPKVQEELRTRCNKINEFRRGKTYDEIYGAEQAKEIIIRMKGKTPWNKGILYPEELKKILSKAQQGKKWPKDKYPTHGMRGKTFSEESKLKLSKAFSGSKHPMFGKKHSKESIDKMKKSHSGAIVWNKGIKGMQTSWAKGLKGDEWRKHYPNGTSNGMLGKSHTQEWKNKMSIMMEGKNNPMYGKYGKESHMWKGGLSYEPYSFDFNKRFKEAVRERDNYACVVCNLFEDDCITLYKKKLNIHHIDYDKKNSFPQNCVSLCNKCHSITNYNRDHWKTFFQSLLKERYGYEYTLDQKIILDFTQNEK